jgi:hypothetical protein
MQSKNKDVNTITNALDEFEKLFIQIDSDLNINISTSSEEDERIAWEKMVSNAADKQEKRQMEEDAEAENYIEQDDYNEELRGRKPLSFELFDNHKNDDEDILQDKDDYEQEEDDMYTIGESNPSHSQLNTWDSQEDYSRKRSLVAIKFINYLSEIRNCIIHGNMNALRHRLNDLQEILNNDMLSDLLIERTGKDEDEISRMLFSIIDQINFNDFFENELHTLPRIITELTEEILYQLSRHPELIHSLESRLFEELIGKIFSKFKLKTSVTKRTRDGGIDIVAFEDTIFSKNNYIIECKRYAPHNKVSVDVVQRLYGIKQSKNVTKAFLVTSSSFTKSAMKWAKQHCWELELKDYTDIVKWLRTFW